MGLTSALATAGRSLELFSLGIQVAGQNISNATTPGYVRDELQIQSSLPVRQGGVLVGSGATAVGVRQQLDKYLESRIYTANSDASASQARVTSYQQLENALQELGDSDLSSGLNNFLARIQDVVNQPEQPALRQLAVQQGQQLAANISALRLRIDDLRQAQSEKVNSLVEEANGLIGQIQKLNPRISEMEASGLDRNEAGGLRIQRLNALNRLSQILPIRVIEQPSGAVDVYTGNEYLILANQAQQLETVPISDRGMQVNRIQLSQTNSLVNSLGGELQGATDGRDKVLGGFVEQLDKFASALIFEFNRVYSSGEGLKGFASQTSSYGVASSSAALNAAGLAFPPRQGSFQVKVVNVATGQAETTDVPVDLDGIGGDTTLDDLRAALGGIANVTATITNDGRLKLTADSGYEIRFGNDTSGVLAALGLNTFFTGSDSGSIGVNSTVLNDSAYFAAGQGGGPADGSNAVQLAQLTSQPLTSLGGRSLDQFYSQTVGSLAQSSSAESALSDGFAGYRDSLLNQREQTSGVSLDEEAIRIMQYQQAYASAARIISTVDQLFQTLLQV